MLNEKPEWNALEEHRTKMQSRHMRDLFSEDPERPEQFSISCKGLKVDFSRQLITAETLNLLIDLAKACDIQGWRERMFAGEHINNTEDRAVLHTALRAPPDAVIKTNGDNVVPFVHDVLGKMKSLSEAVRNGSWTGYTGKPIRSVINIGIGGSDLGPRMVCEALTPFISSRITVHFVSNIDPSDITEALKKCDPETTLFIIASKTFTTQETMTNAGAAKDWLLQSLKDKQAIVRHFVALSANKQAVSEFGIDPANMFPFRDWVGGRYSLWSSIGLSICIAAGPENFQALLDGAHAMDNHFYEAPLDENIPVVLGLLGIWHRNFFDAASYAVLPYNHYLTHFGSWLQQLDMESNGKFVDRYGARLNYQTGPVVFGQLGTNAQHAITQLIHQGTTLIPCDFIAALENPPPLGDQHRILLANMMAQAQALMLGRTPEEADGNPHRVFEGNRPSSLILLKKLDPFHLGMLLALYEHKIFVQGIVWNINSFDQWGVELGKEMAGELLATSEDFIKF